MKEHVIGWVVNKVRRRIPALIAVTLFSSGSAVLGVLFALGTRRIIDAAVSGEGFMAACLWELWVICGLLVCGGLTKYLSQRLTCQLDRDWKRELLRDLLRGEYEQLAAYHSGELINRLNNDVRTLDEALVAGVPGAFSMVVRLTAALVVLAMLWPVFTLVLVAAGVLMVAGTGFVRRGLKKLHKQVSQSEGKVLSFFQEALEKLLVVQAMDLSGEVERRADGVLQTRWELQRKQRRVSLLTGIGVNVCYYSAGLAVLVWCAWSLLHGQMTFGTLTAVMQLFDQLQSPFLGLSGLLPRYAAAAASAERLMELASIRPARVRRVCTHADEITAREVTFAYGEDAPVLDRVSFTVPEGAFVAVTGASGAGKSTLLKLMLGVYRPESGTLVVRNGKETVDLADGTRGLFAYVPQGNFLFSGTIRENLTIVRPDAGEEEITRAVRASAMDAFLPQLPQGLDTVLGENGAGLSEGQVQRLAIARAILSGAPVLLLDEATSALDVETERTVLRRIAELPGRTCIAVTHRPAALEMADLRLELSDARAVETRPRNG